MKVKGKYKVVVKDHGLVIKTIETDNMVVDSGLQHLADWMQFDHYSENYFPAIKQIDTTGMTIANAGFSNPANSVDGSDTSAMSAVINSTSWGTDWWTIDFGEDKDIIAIYVDWMEDDSNYGADYKFEYSGDGSSWTDFNARLRAPQESNVRGKVLFLVEPGPPFIPVTARYIRLNTKKGNDDENFYVYQLKFYEPNFNAMPPGVIALGDGTIEPPPSGSETSLQSLSIAKQIVGSVQPSGFITRFIMSLDEDEGNNTVFTEAGLFFANNDYDIPSSVNATNMFSRAIFYPSGWYKTSGQTADVYYEIGFENT